MIDSLKTINLNGNAKKVNSYDAIVVGSGISGGWAAKELCEKGLKTLVLERGRNIEHVKDYHTAFKNPWDFTHRLVNTQKDKEECPIQSQAFDPGNKHFFVNDKEHPYIQDNPFSWVRGYHVGGRSLTWGRQCYRLSDLDFEANLKDGIAVDWPIRYKDIAPWYDYVEKYVGISGRKEGLAQLPDGEFLPPIDLNCIEAYFEGSIKKNYQDRVVTPSRVANLTEAKDGRGPCQYRNLCSRGCPFSAYFSSNGVTLPAAAITGNLTLVPNAIVAEVMYDKETKKALGVKVIDAITKQETEYFAKIIFLNASTIATASILLNSTSEAFPQGLGNSSGQIGHNLMDHFQLAGASGIYEGFEDKYYFGRSPGSIHIPRFRNINAETKQKDFIRGYGIQGKGERLSWDDLYAQTEGVGAAFKDKITKPGPWEVWLGGWGETLPYFDNKVTLDPSAKDSWGLPIIRVAFKYGDNEKAMRKDIKQSCKEMLEKAGFTKINAFDYDQPPGSAVHEMGTARMGHDPKTSVLNANNQMHDVDNVFITDGSCMTSSATQNPSLTYMALTARACSFALESLKKGTI